MTNVQGIRPLRATCRQWRLEAIASGSTELDNLVRVDHPEV